MKVFLSILLYLVCSECRIEDGSIEQVPYNVLGSGRADDVYKNYNPILIKDLNDYTDFYLNYYGAYPGYTDFDFTKNMMAVFFVSDTRSDIEIENIYETNDQISIHMNRPALNVTRLHYTSCQVIEPMTHFMAISLKRSNKVIKVYN